MKYATRDDIKELLATTADAAVSLYMPTHRVSSPPHVSEDATRYKNLVRRAEQLLKEKNTDHDTAQSIVRQLESLMNHQELWQHQADSLAVLVTKDQCHTYNLPITIDEYVAVDERFHLTPLMLQMEKNQPYIVLALAVHDPKLFEGDLSTFVESDLELPTDPETALNIDEMHVNQLQSRNPAVRQPNSGPSPALFHGHGGSPREVASDERLRFFKMIDEAISKRYDDTRPLVLISTNDQIVEYKSVAKYGNIIDSSVEGNRTQDDLAELHKLTSRVVQSSVSAPRTAELLNSFEELVAQNRSVTDTTEIQALSTEGRIDTLLVGMAINTTDTVTDQIESVPKVVFPEHYEAIDVTAKDVFEQSGRVVGLSREQMPQQAAMAAILRY